eukprot:CAMPEP_0174269374 /NCGR_PEP_ID=MMETSP0439-20130205/40767_1 /TAXON_ID=0 /ORGANISM="Stereomyxa ramosa, Strain Chinc5" /LENGTH=1270 /DNA_ID=CAMNT_0015358109 /DNA_START=6 /DNA_END=3818 /DNA_ORIENTATION=+
MATQTSKPVPPPKPQKNGGGLERAGTSIVRDRSPTPTPSSALLSQLKTPLKPPKPTPPIKPIKGARAPRKYKGIRNPGLPPRGDRQAEALARVARTSSDDSINVASRSSSSPGSTLSNSAPKPPKKPVPTSPLPPLPATAWRPDSLANCRGNTDEPKLGNGSDDSDTNKVRKRTHSHCDVLISPRLLEGQKPSGTCIFGRVEESTAPKPDFSAKPKKKVSSSRNAIKMKKCFSEKLLQEFSSNGDSSDNTSEDDQTSTISQDDTEALEYFHRLLDESTSYPFSSDDVDEYILFKVEETQSGQKVLVKAGVLTKLVQRLTYTKQPDPNFESCFLLTYRSFSNPMELMDLLIKRFVVPIPQILKGAEVDRFNKLLVSHIHLRVFKVLKTWVSTHFYDFSESEELFKRLKDFISNTMAPASPTMKRAAAQLSGHIEKQLQGSKAHQVQFSREKPPPITTGINGNKFEFIELDSIEIARQLTLIEYQLYKSIRPKECVGQAWTKKVTRDKEAANIMNMIARFNSVSRWVCHSIVQKSDIWERAEMLEKFLDITQALRNLNNYNGMMEVLSGLQNSCVYRLKATWALMPKKKVKAFEEVRTLMSRDQSFTNFRTHLHQVNPPCIPYLGVFLTDLTFIEEGNQSRDPENPNMINFDKCRKIWKVIEEIERYQGQPYCYEEVHCLREYFLEFDVDKLPDDGELFKISQTVEPKGTEVPPRRKKKASFKSRKWKTKPKEKKQEDTRRDEIEEEEEFGELDAPEDYPFFQVVGNSNLLYDVDLSTLVQGARRSIKAADLVRLIERITSEDSSDPQLVQTFLLTYHLFATEVEIVELLKQRWKIPLPKNQDQTIQEKYQKSKVFPIRIRVFNLTKNWIDKYFQPHCFEDQKVLQSFMSLADLIMETQPQKGEKIKESLQREQENYELEKKEKVSPQESPFTITWSASSSTLNLTLFRDFEPVYLAQQLTMIEQNFFKSVKMWEILTSSALGCYDTETIFHDEDMINNAYSMLLYEYHNLWLGNLIKSSILGQPNADLKDSLFILDYWIQTANECLNIKNFNSTVIIAKTLRTNDIRPLLTLWQATGAPVTAKANFTSLCELLTSHYAKIQARIQSVQPPLIPYLGAYQYGIDNILKSQPDTVTEHNLINFSKYTIIATELGQIIQSQRAIFDFPEYPEILALLQDFTVLTPEEIQTKAVEMQELITADPIKVTQELTYFGSNNNIEKKKSSSSGQLSPYPGAAGRRGRDQRSASVVKLPTIVSKYLNKDKKGKDLNIQIK